MAILEVRKSCGRGDRIDPVVAVIVEVTTIMVIPRLACRFAGGLNVVLSK